MTYRTALKSDYDKIRDYCIKYDIAVPEQSVAIFIAEDNGEIKGIIALKQVYQIEPLISETPLVSNNLFRMVDGVIKQNQIQSVRAIVDKEKYHNGFFKVLDKEDFLIIEDNKLILERT